MNDAMVASFMAAKYGAGHQSRVSILELLRLSARRYFGRGAK